MGSTEQELKDLIIKKYGNLSKFCEVIDMPWTTLDSILKRGVSKANISNIMKITQELNIDTESLAVGLIAPKKEAVPIAFLPIENSENSSDKALARLIKYYGMLNSVGRGKAVERMEELAQILPYTEE